MSNRLLIKAFFIWSIVSSCLLGMEKPEIKQMKQSIIDDALLFAVRNGCLIDVQDLIQKGANVNACDQVDCTILMNAITYASPESTYLPIIDELIRAGADVRMTGKEKDPFKSPLCWAISFNRHACVKRLLRYNVPRGQALLIALEPGHEEIARELIKHGVAMQSVFVLEDAGITEYFKQIKKLLSGNPLLVPVIRGDKKQLGDLIMQYENSANSSYLHEALLYAAGQGQLGCAAMLLQADIPHEILITALEYAVHGGRPDMIRAFLHITEQKKLLTRAILQELLSLTDSILKHAFFIPEGTKTLSNDFDHYCVIRDLLNGKYHVQLVNELWTLWGTGQSLLSRLPPELVTSLFLFYGSGQTQMFGLGPKKC